MNCSMRNVFLVLLMSFFMSDIFAQEEEAHKVSIRVVLPEIEGMPKEAASQLEDKLKHIVSSSGMSDNGLTERFVLTAKVNVLEKDVVATTPVRISQKMEISFYVGDVIENKVYSSTSINVSGIGVNETKSYMEAIKRIPVNSQEIKMCIDKGKHKIVEYYENNCDYIMQEADRLAKAGEYEASIAKLVAVPKVCEICYAVSREKAVAINDERMDVEGLKLISQATAAWNVRQDYEGAGNALDLLSQVHPLAMCREKADLLMESINEKLRIDEAKVAAENARIAQRNWEFKMQQYNDKMEMARTKESNNTMILSKLIGAAENVGCAYGKNQPKSVTNTVMKRW